MVGILIDSKYRKSYWCKSIYDSLVRRLRHERIPFCEGLDRIDGTFDTATDFGTHTVEHWALGNATQVFMIPSDAPVGDYDLVLSYGGYSQTFERALTLLDPIYKDLDYPPVSDDHFFTFGIETVDGFAIPGEGLALGIKGCVTFTVTTWLFTSMADRISTGPSAKLAPIMSAMGLYLASQIFMGMF